MRISAPVSPPFAVGRVVPTGDGPVVAGHVRVGHGAGDLACRRGCRVAGDHVGARGVRQDVPRLLDDDRVGEVGPDGAHLTGAGSARDPHEVAAQGSRGERGPADRELVVAAGAGGHLAAHRVRTCQGRSDDGDVLALDRPVADGEHPDRPQEVPVPGREGQGEDRGGGQALGGVDEGPGRLELEEQLRATRDPHRDGRERCPGELDLVGRAGAAGAGTGHRLHDRDATVGRDARRRRCGRRRAVGRPCWPRSAGRTRRRRGPSRARAVGGDRPGARRGSGRMPCCR